MKADRFDFELFEKEAKLKKAWEAYQWLAKKFAGQIKIIDGERSPGKISQEILKYVRQQPKFKKIKKQ